MSRPIMVPIEAILTERGLEQCAILIGYPTGPSGSSTGDIAGCHVLATDATVVDLHAVGVNTRVIPRVVSEPDWDATWAAQEELGQGRMF